MENITEKYKITSEIHNFSKTFERDMTKAQNGRFKEMVHGIISGKSSLLSDIARENRSKKVNKTEKVIRKQVEQYSNMIEKMPFEKMMIRKLCGFKNQIKSDTPIYFDLVDISKEFHKKLDCIGTTWNGSEGIPGKGYEIIDLSIEQNFACTTLLRHTYSTIEKEYKSEVFEFEKVLNKLRLAFGEIKGTFFFDKGADSDNMIDKNIEHEASFVIRMNTNRGTKDRIFLNGNSEEIKMMDIWENKKVQGFTTWQDKKKRKNKKIVQLKWEKIFWKKGNKKSKKLIPLTLIWCHRKDDKEPAVFLTSRSINNESDAIKVYHQYFARGQEEACFKFHKDKLGMEKVRLQSFQKVKQLMLLYVFVDQVISNLRLRAIEIGTLLYSLIKDFLKGNQRTINKWSVVDFYNYIFSLKDAKPINCRRRFPPDKSAPQLALAFYPFKNGE